MHKLSVWYRRIPSMLFAVTLLGLPGLVRAEVFAPPAAAPDRLDVEVAWQIQLPARQTMSFKSFHLLEGQIYAMATDGSVVVVRADTGELVWSRKLADEGSTVWPPVMYRTQSMHAVVFGRISDVILLDPRTGAPLHLLRLNKPSVCPIAVAAGRVFVNQPNGRLAAYRLRDGYVFWRAAFEDQFTIPPLYAPAINAVVAVDEVGLVAGLRNEPRPETRLIFRQFLRSEPSGQPALDGDMLYLSTMNQTLHAIDMGRDEDSNAGDIVWQYRLARQPQGGPVLSRAAIYQATRGGGLHRIAKVQGQFRNWFDPQAVQMLAEWPEGVVVLRSDGSVALIDNDPARPVAMGRAGGFTAGLVNTWNDALFFTSPEGTIRCLRPADAPPLTLASFLPQGGIEIPAEPDEPTEIDRLREAARKKRDKIAGILPEPQVEIAQAPAAEVPAVQQAEAAPTAAEPYDPLRSKRPVVR